MPQAPTGPAHPSPPGAASLDTPASPTSPATIPVMQQHTEERADPATDAVRTDRGLEMVNAGSGNSLGDGRTAGGDARALHRPAEDGSEPGA
ncbi:hypothetical protein [Paracidovorax valerianellae]|uniref:Uncharacterized protein n=1 Tax=Paracidovorax valerianellae TaxID=187868 RepID=A0A1G6YQB3_9BURK|nr:hypothetical protein [Paracidovorax valerianellae]MDA8447387.1 hypothetical protein [Paracidovorax valerianellae]SDD91736.1 hypothetical protein SAMN05192589_110113 [Paracidovorax valerianellae]